MGFFNNSTGVSSLALKMLGKAKYAMEGNVGEGRIPPIIEDGRDAWLLRGGGRCNSEIYLSSIVNC